MSGHRLELIWGLAFALGAGAQLLARLSGLPAVVLLLALPVVALLAHLWAGLSWSLALVFSAIVLSTGPTVITPMVRQMRLEPLSARMLEAEGLILEPLAAVMALVLLELALGAPGGWQEAGARLLRRLVGGVVLGGAAGALLALLLRRLGERADPALQLQLCIGTLFLVFSGAESLLPESGLPAAVSAGVALGLALGQAVAPFEPLVAELAMLAITVLFPLLAADLGWRDLEQLSWGGLACVLALLVLRWLVVQVAGLGLTALDWRRKLILSWIAPRGIVTAAVASLFALQLEEAGQPGGAALKGLVFLTILFTVSVQGFTAPWLARWLGLVEEPPEPLAAGPAKGAAEL